MNQKITCIVCPLGCQIDVQTAKDKIIKVSGQSCKRGETYAAKEITDPRRTLTTTVMLKDGQRPVISVKTDKPIPKGLIIKSMSIINKTTINAPVKIGDVIIPDILGTGSNIVATDSAH